MDLAVSQHIWIEGVILDKQAHSDLIGSTGYGVTEDELGQLFDDPRLGEVFPIEFDDEALGRMTFLTHDLHRSCVSDRRYGDRRLRPV